MPLALPPMAATGLFAFMLSYAEFMFSMVLSGDASEPAGLGGDGVARAQSRTSPGACSTPAIFIAILPTLILVALVWRYVLADLVRGAVKG